jgi:hypothetical protein
MTDDTDDISCLTTARDATAHGLHGTGLMVGVLGARSHSVYQL